MHNVSSLTPAAAADLLANDDHVCVRFTSAEDTNQIQFRNPNRLVAFFQAAARPFQIALAAILAFAPLTAAQAQISPDDQTKSSQKNRPSRTNTARPRGIRRTMGVPVRPTRNTALKSLPSAGPKPTTGQVRVDSNKHFTKDPMAGVHTMGKPANHKKVSSRP